MCVGGWKCCGLLVLVLVLVGLWVGGAGRNRPDEIGERPHERPGLMCGLGWKGPRQRRVPERSGAWLDRCAWAAVRIHHIRPVSQTHRAPAHTAYTLPRTVTALALSTSLSEVAITDEMAELPTWWAASSTRLSSAVSNEEEKGAALLPSWWTLESNKLSVRPIVLASKEEKGNGERTDSGEPYGVLRGTFRTLSRRLTGLLISSDDTTKLGVAEKLPMWWSGLPQSPRSPLPPIVTNPHVALWDGTPSATNPHMRFAKSAKATDKGTAALATVVVLVATADGGAVGGLPAWWSELQSPRDVEKSAVQTKKKPAKKPAKAAPAAAPSHGLPTRAGGPTSGPTPKAAAPASGSGGCCSIM